MARQIIINLTDEEEQIMLDMVPDIEAWLRAGPLAEKIANHRGRIADTMVQRLRAANAEVIPGRVADLVTAYFQDPNYKNRQKREASNADK